MTDTDTASPALDLHRPLETTLDLHRLLTHFFPVAIRRQLWTLFLDAADVPLPVVVPLEGIPLRPLPDAVGRWADAVQAVAREFGASRVVFVVERTGSRAVRASDTAWRDALLRSLDDRPCGVRAVATCTDDGVDVLIDVGALGAAPGSAPSPASTEEAPLVEPAGQASPSRRAASERVAVR
ncbi:hypothetical protein [Frigoribacterium endophyticum]|uniref:hypothetical protein n=1 Tax=Frigoribacterium endophyticum TaxID=1522176 RepID=UPI001420B604|nr:hypothetical protein [Frigoribacterium endophyticum]NII50800.1 hypothetical protein [Frigoribacterium endophyticum]